MKKYIHEVASMLAPRLNNIFQVSTLKFPIVLESQLHRIALHAY